MSAPEDHQLRQLDQRGADASADLAARAAARPVPSFDPVRAVVSELPTSRPRTPGRILAVAAVILVVAAIAGVLVAQIRDDGSDKAKVISGKPRPFVAGDLPDGFAFAGAGEITADEGQSDGVSEVDGSGPVALYGPDDDDPQLGIAVFPKWEAADANPSEIEAVDLGGRTAYRYDGMGFGKHALVIPDGEGAVIVLTSSMDAEWLEALASDLTVDDDGTIDLHGFSLPQGWRELGEVPELLSLVSPMLATMNPASVGNYAIYLKGAGETATASESSSSDGSSSSSGSGTEGDDDQKAPEPRLPTDSGLLMVSSTPGDTTQVHAAALVADTATKTTVRGHEALITTTTMQSQEPVATRTVTWIERPGELVRVSGSGLDERELLAAAESLEPVNAAEWKDLVERSELGEFDPANADGPPRIKVGEGRFPDGSRWILTASVPQGSGTGPEGSGIELASAHISVSVAEAGNSSSSSSSGMGTVTGPSDPAAVFGLEVLGTGGRSFAGALVSSDVARVEVRTGDEQVEAEAEIVEGGGYRGVAVELTGETASLVALAADGTELGRIGVSAEDHGGSAGGTDTTIITGSGD